MNEKVAWLRETTNNHDKVLHSNCTISNFGIYKLLTYDVTHKQVTQMYTF